jgi:hypothetical protein
MSKFLWASLTLALASPLAAQADTAADLAALKQAIATMRTDYEARLRDLEQRLREAEAKSSGASTTTPEPLPPPVTGAPSAPAAPPASAGAFNPALSLILSGVAAHTSRDPANYAIGGLLVPAGGEIGPGTRGFSLAESELGISASIDPWWRGSANISLHPDDTVSVEEAFVETTSLGNGLSLKLGRFFSGIGYLNSQHSHTWDFVDNPLAYQALLGTQFGDDGVQLSWIAPTDLYVALGAELGRGRSFPGGNDSRNGTGMAALTAHLGGDVGDSHNWRAGVSVLQAKADAQSLSGFDTAGNPIGALFNGRTRVWVADAVWKWAPGGNATRTNFKLQGEFIHSTRDGTLVVDPGGAGTSGAYRATPSGWYVQGVYQFMPAWRLGLRTERVSPGNNDSGVSLGLGDLGGYQPRKDSLMVDFSASEFSRLRLQFARDRARLGSADNQFFLQYQMSLGAHGAHNY